MDQANTFNTATTTTPRRLYRSRSDRKIAGVAGGLVVRDDAKRWHGATCVVDVQRPVVDGHEQDVDREAHPERVDGAAVREEDAGVRGQPAQTDEAEQPLPVAGGDEQDERRAVGSLNVEDVHAVQTAHFQVKERAPRNYSERAQSCKPPVSGSRPCRTCS